jgi:hypothetical protein
MYMNATGWLHQLVGCQLAIGSSRIATESCISANITSTVLCNEIKCLGFLGMKIAYPV